MAEEEEEEEEDGEYREPGELHEDSVESLQDPLKRKEMKTTEMDRSHKEKKRKSINTCSSSTSGSRYASITCTDSKYVQVRLSEGNEDIGKVRARSSRWGEEAPLCSDEASEPQVDVKNRDLWKKDVFQPSKACRWSEYTSSSPSPLSVKNCAMQKDHDYLISRASRCSEETSLNVENSSSFRLKNHISQQKDDVKASKTSRQSEMTPTSRVKNQNLQKKDDFQASVEASPNEDKSLSFHETNHVSQKKDDFRVSKASRWSEETSIRKEKLSSFHVKNQELLKKADFESSKASRWSEEVSPSEEKLSASSVKNQDWQERDDFKASKASRWSAETSPSEEKVSSSHVKNNVLQKKDDFQISKESKWLGTPPRKKKPSSLHLKNRDLQKKADFEASKATRWSKETSPCEEKSFLFGVKNQGLEKKDSFEVKSELSTDDDDDSSEEDEPKEYMKIKSDVHKINGVIESSWPKRKSSPGSESQIYLRANKDLDMVRSSPWKEEILLNREIPLMFQGKNQDMQGKADSEAKSEHETDDEQGVKCGHSEAYDYMKTSFALGEISRVNICRGHSVKERGYPKEADLNSCRHSSDEGVHDDDEDGVVSFFPEEMDPADYKIDMLKGCRSVEEFEMVKRINEGTYGVVYKAKDKKSGEIMALKKVKMEKERDGFPMTSLREINILLSIHHPCIVNVKEVVVGNSMDSIYMVMEYMEHDLKRFMGTLEHPFSQSQVKCLMLKLFEGIKHLHDNWVLHRDLKTSNILLNNQGELKICDFGLARQYGSPLKTYTSLVVTLWYRSPELLLGCREYSTAVDMWSLGCIMAELLSKEPLFCGKNEVDQIDKIFRTLGTPDEIIWPDFSNLPGVKCSFVKQRFNRLREKFPPTAFAGGVTLSNKGFDLLSRLLMYDPKKRITSEDALNHEWFKEFPLPIMPDLSSLKRTGVSKW